MISKSGIVGLDKVNSEPSYKPGPITFTPPGKSFDLILQVANFTYARGGVWYEIQMGSPAAIDSFAKGIYDRGLLMLGAFIMMALTYFSFFWMHRKEKSSLFLSLLCIASACRILVSGNFWIYNIFPGISFDYIVRLEYFSIILGSFSVFLFIACTFKEELPDYSSKVATILFFFQTITITVFPVDVYTKHIIVFEIIALLMSAGGLLLTFKAMHQRRVGAPLILIGFSICTTALLRDILLQNNYITGDSGDLTPISVLIMIFLQGLVLARRYSNALRQSEKLTETIQNKLEKEKQITAQLEISLKEVQEYSTKIIAAEMAFLQAQIKPHFIFNALSVIASLSIKEPEKAKEIVLDFADYLRLSFDFDNNSGLTTLENEISLVKAYLSIEQARFANRLNVVYDIDEDINCTIPMLCIQPLVENAVRHGLMKNLSSGSIMISVKWIERYIIIAIEDNGEGIDIEFVNNLLSSASSKGHVGIRNIHNRLEKLYREGLNYKAGLEVGTRVSFRIPYASKEEINEYIDC